MMGTVALWLPALFVPICLGVFKLLVRSQCVEKCFCFSNQMGFWIFRSIRGLYLKDWQFNMEPNSSKFRLPEPFGTPLLSANAATISHPLHQNDSFPMFASDGLWEHLTNGKVVEIVHSNSWAGSAKRLVKAALQEAVRKLGDALLWPPEN